MDEIDEQDDLKVIQRAKERIQKGRARFSFAVDINGCEVPPNDPKACRWCLLGALGMDYSAMRDEELVLPVVEPLYDLLFHIPDDRPQNLAAKASRLGNWNDQDGTTKEKILALFERAEKKIIEDRANERT
jgi:hypothetical protein